MNEGTLMVFVARDGTAESTREDARDAARRESAARGRVLVDMTCKGAEVRNGFRGGVTVSILSGVPSVVIARRARGIRPGGWPSWQA